MTDHILTKINDGVLEIRMNRPEKKNALTNEIDRKSTRLNSSH